MQKKTNVWMIVAWSGWPLAVATAMLLWVVHTKYERANEEAWRNLNRLAVAETAYEKMEKYVERIENRAARYSHWKKRAAVHAITKEGR